MVNKTKAVLIRGQYGLHQQPSEVQEVHGEYFISRYPDSIGIDYEKRL